MALTGPFTGVRDQVTGRKSCTGVDCERHIDLSDQELYVDEAVAAVDRFLHEPSAGGAGA